jgi:hypothetical protein
MHYSGLSYVSNTRESFYMMPAQDKKRDDLFPLQAITHKIVDYLLQGYTEQEIGTMEGVSQQAIHQQWKSIQRMAWSILRNA